MGLGLEIDVSERKGKREVGEEKTYALPRLERAFGDSDIGIPHHGSVARRLSGGCAQARGREGIEPEDGSMGLPLVASISQHLLWLQPRAQPQMTRELLDITLFALIELPSRRSPSVMMPEAREARGSLCQ